MNTNESGMTESGTAEFNTAFNIALNIDDIVRSVLGDVCPSVPEPEPPALEGMPIALRIISLEDVRNLHLTNKQIFVSPKSLLTPSAKDELRKRNIEIVRCAPAANRKNSAAELSEAWGWCGVFPADAASETLKTQLAKLLNRQLETFGSISEMLSIAEKQTGQPPHRTAVITSSPALVMYAACRSAVLRPVFGIDPRQMTEDAAELHANMLVLSSKSFFIVQKMGLIKTFLFRK